MTFFMIRNRRAEQFWLNDLDHGVSNYHEVVQKQCAALVPELLGLLEAFGRCSRDLFDHARQMVESDDRVEAAAGFYIRNRLARSGCNGMTGQQDKAGKVAQGVDQGDDLGCQPSA